MVSSPDSHPSVAGSKNRPRMSRVRGRGTGGEGDLKTTRQAGPAPQATDALSAEVGVDMVIDCTVPSSVVREPTICGWAMSAQTVMNSWPDHAAPGAVAFPGGPS